MKSILVRLKKDSYPIVLGSYETQFPAYLKKRKIKPTHILILSPHAVSKAGYPAKLRAALKKKGFQSTLVTTPNGESVKSLEHLKGLYGKALKVGLDRHSLIVAMGGGVTTDLAGFLAATYMRGISYVSVPTSLLGMVDAAIGGKTGIDLKEGKNLVGAFWQPRLVWIDTKILSTLSSREWRTGFAEIVKYGVIKNRSFFLWLEKELRKNPQIMKWSSQNLERAIFESVRIKAQVVSKDEKEQPLKGGREILNFGHTIGHALEAATVYKKLNHGEAISIGMAAAGNMAIQKGMWGFDEQLRLLSLLEVVGLPLHCPLLSQREKKLFWDSLKKDKKHISGKLRFVLPQRLGRVVVQSGVPVSLVKRALQSVSF